MNLRVYAAAASGIFRRDLTVYVSYRWRLATQYIGVLFSLAIFYYISRLVRVGQFSSPDAYFEFAAVGVIIVQVLQSTLDIPTAVRQELVAGTFERMAISPFGPVLAILAAVPLPIDVGSVLDAGHAGAGDAGLRPRHRLGERASGDPRGRGRRDRPRCDRAVLRRHDRALQAGAGSGVRGGRDLARRGVLLPAVVAPVVAGVGVERAAVHALRWSFCATSSSISRWSTRPGWTSRSCSASPRSSCRSVSRRS